MIIPLELDNIDIGISSINLVSKDSISKDYYPDYIPTNLIDNNTTIEPLHYSHINMENYKSNQHKIVLTKIAFNLIPNMTYDFSILVKTNNYYIDDNQWKIYIEIVSKKTNNILEKMDYYKISSYTDNNNSFGWFLIKWYWRAPKTINTEENYNIIFNSIGIDKCPLSNNTMIYSIMNPKINLMEYCDNLIPNDNLRHGWDEYSIYQINDTIEDTILQWNTILDWNCKNIVYPNEIIDKPIIKFKFNYSYINDEQRKLYHTYWQCKKNILPLKPYTNYIYSIYIKTTPSGVLLEQYNALYTNKLNLNNIDYRPKSVYAIIYIGNNRDKLKSEKIEIKPTISGSIYPHKPVIDNDENKIENNGWVKCIWKFNTEDLLKDDEKCINLYLFTYSLRPNIMYLYHPQLIEEFEYVPVLPNTKINTSLLTNNEKKILIINNSITTDILQYFLVDSLQISSKNIDRNVNEVNSVLDYTNIGIIDIIIYFFNSNNDIDISINELLKPSLFTKLPNDIKLFIIIDKQPILDLENKIMLKYSYHNRKITTINDNILEVEKYPTNLFILGWTNNDTQQSLIELLIDKIKINNYNLSIMDILNEIDNENLILYYNRDITKYDMFVNHNKTTTIF